MDICLNFFHKNFGWFESRNKMLRNLDGLSPLDVPSDFGSPLFDNETTETTNINVLSALNNASTVTSTSTFEMPVFSEMAFTRSAFLMIYRVDFE
jgi:hypothetical protein